MESSKRMSFTKDQTRPNVTNHKKNHVLV